MKKTARQKTVYKPEKQRSGGHKTGTILVLVLAAAAFSGMFFWLHSEDILKGANQIFSTYGEEIVEFEKATVTAITAEDMEADPLAEEKYNGNQELKVIVKSGRYKGEEMTVYNYFGSYYGVPVEVGDGVVITIKTHDDGAYSATVYEVNRIPILGALLILFCLAVIIVGGRTGLKSLVGLGITVLCLFTILIPLLLKGAPTILTTFFVCAFIALVSFTILGGVHRKTISAFLGTIAGVCIAMLLGMTVQSLAKIDGFRLEEAEPLLQLKQAGVSVRLSGLLVAGILISALGAVMDVAMSISSALEEVHAANPSLSRAALFRSGMNIGRDMVGTMTNTLILAFLGSGFTLILYLYSLGLARYQLFTSAYAAIEIISGVASSIGMILAIPVTALISAAMIARRGEK